MEIKQVTFIYHRYDSLSKNILDVIPNDIEKVDVFTDESNGPLEEMHSPLEWIQSCRTWAEQSDHSVQTPDGDILIVDKDWVDNNDMIRWRGTTAFVIITPPYRYHSEEYSANIATECHFYELNSNSTWQDVLDYVSIVNERAHIHPPT
jgi:hypothetical protein